MTLIETLAADHDLRQKELRIINEEMEKAIREAANAVREQFRARRIAASTVVNEALSSLEGARIAEAAVNPLIGRRVAHTQHKYPDRWSRKAIEVVQYGILEVMTAETTTPLNQRYSLPKNGDIFVRILKGDGTAGARIDIYWEGGKWKLVEEVQA